MAASLILKLLGLKSDIEVLSSHEIIEGEVYAIKKREFHLSETNVESVTATIVWNERLDCLSPIVIGSSDSSMIE